MLPTLSVLRYVAYNASMFDLGMAQAIWSSTRGRPLEFSYRGAPLSRLALHVELVYFLLTPLYALFASPITLLVVQAILFGAGGFPLYYLAKRRTGSLGAARVITLIYLLYPVAHTALLFDFHGDTLAMPLLLFAFKALDRRSWLAYSGWLLLALSCKVYVAAPVCALGVFLWLKGCRRVGALTFVAGAAWGLVMFFGVRPLFTTADAGGGQLSPLGYAQFYFGELYDDLARSWYLRLATGILLFAPALPVALYALDCTGLAPAVALPVLLSSGPGPSYYLGAHHYAVAVPFLIMIPLNATLQLQNRSRLLICTSSRRSRSVTWPVALGAAAFATLLANVGLVNTPLSSRYRALAPDSGFLGLAYRRTSRDVLKDAWLAHNVPDGAPVLASMMLAPHLSNRQELHTAVPLDDTPPPPIASLLDVVDYVVLDGLLDYVEKAGRNTMSGNVTYDWLTLAAAIDCPEFGLVSAQDGLLMLQRRARDSVEAAWAEMTLDQSVVVEPGRESATPRAMFGDFIALVDASVTSLGDGRYRFRYAWSALRQLGDRAPLFAVTQLLDVANARILHIPTIALYPTTAWQRGDLVTETFKTGLPADLAPGEYTAAVGWYDSGNTYACATDERSRIGVTVELVTLDVR